MEITYRPIGNDWPGLRTKSWARKNSPFNRKGRYLGEGNWTPGGPATWTDTMSILDRELRMIEGKRIVFQIDLQERDFRIDGGIRANAKPESPAVIISFDSKHGSLRYFCDQFRDWHDNVRAIALGLEALRKVERYGITHKGEQYSGWKAIGDGSDAPMSEEQARLLIDAYGGEAAALKATHPDLGGDIGQFHRVQKAREILRSKQTA